MHNAAKIVSDAIVGKHMRVITVGGKAYTITPPTIYKIAGAAGHLPSGNEMKSIGDWLTKPEALRGVAAALSWFIIGNDTLAKDLERGTPGEIAEGLDTALNMIAVEDFMKLSALTKNVANLTAKQRTQ